MKIDSLQRMSAHLLQINRPSWFNEGHCSEEKARFD